MPLKKLISLQQAYLEQTWGLSPTIEKKAEDLENQSLSTMIGEKILMAATHHDIKAAEVAHKQMLKAFPKLKVLKKAMMKEV